MPTAEYESRTDSVLAWKKNQKLGRFDPDSGTIEEQKIRASEREVEERGKFDCIVFAFPTDAISNLEKCSDLVPGLGCVSRPMAPTHVLRF